MNAQTTYLHHSPPQLEGTTSSRGRRAEQLQSSHKPYYRSVLTKVQSIAKRRHVSFRNFRRIRRYRNLLRMAVVEGVIYIILSEHMVGIYTHIQDIART